MLGYLNLIMGNYNLSRLYSERALRLNIGMQISALNLGALHNIARSYLLEGKLVKAEEYIDRIGLDKEAQKTFTDWIVTKGQIKLEIGNLPEAEKILNHVFETARKRQNKFEIMLAHASLANCITRSAMRNYSLNT